jgi:hypothetical protein
MKHCNITHLVATANAQGCTIHLRQNENSKPVFSVRDSNNSVHEFASYAAAYEYLTRDECSFALTDEQDDNIAMQDELERMITERAKAETKPRVKISPPIERPALSTLGDILKSTAARQPKACTLITGYSESRWNGLRPSERDLIEIAFEGTTACLDPTNAVTIFIADGTTPAIARAVLKAVAKEIRDFDSFERFTPLVPVSGEPSPF